MPEEKTEKKEEEVIEETEICAAVEHHLKFDPNRYLNGFYKKADSDLAMNVVIFFLPNILCKLPRQVKSLLDLGAGPTVYIPIAFRDRAAEIFTSDYAPANQESLKAWLEDRSPFDWADVCQWIKTLEASHDTAEEMQKKAREKIRAILQVNVHADPVIEDVFYKTSPSVTVPKQFEVVTTIFCLEYSCECYEDYKRAVMSATSLIQPGGWLVQGGVMGAETYSFGGKQFRCHCLEESHIIETLKENGMSTSNEEGGFKIIEYEGVFLLCSKKLR